MNEMAISRDIAVRPDAIIVLGAGLRVMYDTIVCSIQSVHNVEKGVELVTEYKDVALVFSGGFTLDSETEATAMRKYFKKVYPEIDNDTYLEIQSKNSYGNVYYCLNLVKKEQWSNIVIVDQPMHLFQLKLLANKELRKRKSNVRINFVASEPVWGNNIQKQWKNPFVFGVYEFLSTRYYLLKGKII